MIITGKYFRFIVMLCMCYETRENHGIEQETKVHDTFVACVPWVVELKQDKNHTPLASTARKTKCEGKRAH